MVLKRSAGESYLNIKPNRNRTRFINACLAWSFTKSNQVLKLFKSRVSPLIDFSILMRNWVRNKRNHLFNLIFFVWLDVMFWFKLVVYFEKRPAVY